MSVTATALSTFAAAAGDPRFSPLAREIAVDLAREALRVEKDRLSRVADVMEALRYGNEAHITADARAVISEARIWLIDCGYSGGAVEDLSDRQVCRIVARHVDGGIDGFVEICGEALPTPPQV